MTLWIVLAVLTVAALAWVGWPLLRPKQMGEARAAYDAAVYLDQLEELERDRARGLIDESQAEAAKIEIERRLLAAIRAEAAPSGPARRHPVLAVAVLALIPLVAIPLYSLVGSPGLPNLPFAEREQAAPASSMAEAARARLADAEKRAAENSDDADVWFDLGRFRLVAGDVAGASEALQRAMDISGGRADIASTYGEALTRAADGRVTPEARAAFTAAAAGNPDDPRARYFLALGDFQEGRRDVALRAWSDLAKSAPANAPWLATVQARIAETARAMGEDPADWLRPVETVGRGPNADDIAAAQQMSPEERTEMIRGMVAGLAARLEENPDDVEGWRRLARSREVLGENEGAAEAYTRALELEPADPETLLRSAVAAGQLGDAETARARLLRLRDGLPPESGIYSMVSTAIEFIEADPEQVAEITRNLGDNPTGAAPAASAPAGPAPAAPAARGPGADDIAAAQQMSDEERAEMIRGMVAGLAARLEENPDDVEGWRRLARSREVLGESEAAAEAYTRALELDPDHPETLLRGAIAAGQLGERDVARARFVRLRDLIPAESEIRGMIDEAIRRIDNASSK